MKNKLHSDAVKRINNYKVLYNAYRNKYFNAKYKLTNYYDALIKNREANCPYYKDYEKMVMIYSNFANTYKRGMNYFAKCITKNKKSANYFNRRYQKRQTIRNNNNKYIQNITNE